MCMQDSAEEKIMKEQQMKVMEERETRRQGQNSDNTGIKGKCPEHRRNDGVASWRKGT